MFSHYFFSCLHCNSTFVLVFFDLAIIISAFFFFGRITIYGILLKSLE